MENKEKSKLDEALAKAQDQFDTVVFDKVNPHFKSKFGSIAAINKATRPALSRNGLSLTQRFNRDPEGIILITRLGHESGELLESEILIIRANKTDQQLGASFTYMRRYSIIAILNVVAEEEDDGEVDRKKSEETISEEEIEMIEVLLEEYPHRKQKLIDMCKGNLNNMKKSVYLNTIDWIKAPPKTKQEV